VSPIRMSADQKYGCAYGEQEMGKGTLRVSGQVGSVFSYLTSVWISNLVSTADSEDGTSPSGHRRTR
jgi:hypothetical protein